MIQPGPQRFAAPGKLARIMLQPHHGAVRSGEWNSMKTWSTLIVAVLALGAAGCTSERTRNMVDTCQGLLENGDQASAKTFIRDAEKQLASLGTPGNQVTTYLRGLQDPDAMVHKPALEQCVWMLKWRQA